MAASALGAVGVGAGGGGRARLAVLGGGIVGLSCAIALRLAGHRVTLIARESLLDGLALPPLVASAFPAASVLAHSVRLEGGLGAHLRAGAAVFDELGTVGSREAVVRRQPHYELFDHPPGNAPPTALYDDVVGFEDLDARERDLLGSTFAPGRALEGWRLTVRFVEYPRYVARLAALARSLGLGLERETVGRATLARPDVDGFVNCLGAGGDRLLDDDPLRSGLIAGVLLRDRRHSLADCRGELGLFSYNAWIGSGPCRHRNRDGTPTDSYCYPRSDCLVLGGTRELLPDLAAAARPGRIRPPESLLATHRHALRELHGIRLDERRIEVAEGFRAVRLSGAGGIAEPRIELTGTPGRPLVHCYGFGGAGVTLSWLAAAEVVRLLAGAFGAGAERGLGARIEELRADLAGALAGSG